MKLYLINAIKHFKLITIHKYYVFMYCRKAGITWRGIVHDFSKYSPTEFFESVKYYTGTDSPINNCKKVNGYSEAWMHHKGRNKHHYEYWQDDFDHGGKQIQIPFKYALELVCDYLAAGKAYMKKDFSYDAEYNWWLNKKSNPIAMHPQTMLFVDMMLRELKNRGTYVLRRKNAKKIYAKADRAYKNILIKKQSNNEK